MPKQNEQKNAIKARSNLSSGGYLLLSYIAVSAALDHRRYPITLKIQFIHHVYNEWGRSVFSALCPLIRFGAERTYPLRDHKKVADATSTDSRFPFVPLSRNFRNKINRSNNWSRIELPMHEHFLIGSLFLLLSQASKRKIELEQVPRLHLTVSRR